ncbi:MAG TPA: fasciclin domain-containing protein [Amaricoccus sp.]|uniref:fasciclin domain-containing protein n=1 Tax=Amaricoccus sp. TaxID=1872485 RepID=UPI002C236785|nr:fasciclin domain-containing protein [Amaricoccus sp.]HMQ94222.1 fasciclin domain-containing protein [Amaricoccus sp.]HMR52321.1 fasciclin domain-containing protein [Amaricoccus sp.]HMR62044.1 fasciclin domain-containing protein [Amaricoccus sp.]HMT99242.1 fasciclin domain-containing protein [Amaricoccus sp.]
MNRRNLGAILLAGVAAIALSACARAPQNPSIREVVDSNAAFTTLARALTAAGAPSLDDAGPVTVFAPRNSAFDALPEGALDRLMQPQNRGELTRLLQLHVVPGTYATADLSGRTTTLTTLSGLDIVVDGFDGVRVGGADVVQPDVMASNGIIQVTDGVIMPQGLVPGEAP